MERAGVSKAIKPTETSAFISKILLTIIVYLSVKNMDFLLITAQVIILPDLR